MKKTRTDQAGLRGTTRNLTGPKSSLAKAKLGAGDIVVISAPDMSRSIAQRLLDAKVGAVINTDQFTTGRMPNFGPQMLLDSGIELVENAGSDVAAKAKTGKKEAPAHAMAEVAEKEATPLVEDLDGNIEHGA